MALRSVLFLVVLIGLAACMPSTNDTVREESLPVWESAGPLENIFNPDGMAQNEIQGVWRSRGYGWVLEISENSMTRYQEGDVCYATPDETRSMSAMASVDYRYFREIPGEEAAIFQLMEGDTNVVFDRLEGLPDACLEETQTTPTAVADAFLDHFERHYAFFDRRHRDHEAKAELLRSTVTDEMSESELWDALAAFMEGLSDSHTKLIGLVDGEPRRVQDGQGVTLSSIRSGMGETPWLIGLLEQTNAQLGDTAHHVLQDRVLWGVIDGRIGYIQIFVMGGFTDRQDFASPEWADAEMNALNTVLDEALTAFDGLDGVIVDLSNNRGGWDRIAKTLPGRFTDQAFTGFTTQTRGSGLPPFPHVIEPAQGPRFTGPVYLMTSNVTVSGGELATLAFRQLDNVTQVGTITRGAFSTPLAKPLPNGWLLELSNEVFAATDGTVYEETGIVPDIELAIFPEDDPIEGHWQAIEAIIDLMDNGSISQK